MTVSAALVRPRAQAAASLERATSTSGRSLTQSDRTAAKLLFQRAGPTPVRSSGASLPRFHSRGTLNICNSLGGNAHLLLAREAQYAAATRVSVEAGDAVAQLEQQIRLADHWQHIQHLVPELVKSPRPAHLAVCCIHRLGLLHVHVSEYTRDQLIASGLVEDLSVLVAEGVPSLTAVDLLAAFDGYARLQYADAQAVLKPAAAFLPQHLHTVLPGQLPSLMWALGSLKLRPSPAGLSALAHELTAKASGFTPQGVTLTMWACGRLAWHPGHSALSALSDAVQRNLPAFKNDELAACLKAFTAFNYTPSQQLMQVISARAGRTWAPPRHASPARRAFEAAAASGKQAGLQANAAVAASLKRLKKQYQDGKTQAAQAVQAARIRTAHAQLVAAQQAHMQGDTEPWTNMGRTA